MNVVQPSMGESQLCEMNRTAHVQPQQLVLVNKEGEDTLALPTLKTNRFEGPLPFNVVPDLKQVYL